jgi:hypothetical protein
MRTDLQRSIDSGEIRRDVNVGAPVPGPEIAAGIQIPPGVHDAAVRFIDLAVGPALKVVL